MKPKAIASKLRIPVNVVQASIDKFKREAKKLTSPPKPATKVGRKK